MFDGIEFKPVEAPKRWTFVGIFDGPGNYRISAVPDAQGIVEITYPDGVTTLVQGTET